MVIPAQYHGPIVANRGAAVGIFGRAGGLTDQLGIQCGIPSKWCVNNLEDPMCAGVDAATLNKACAKNFSETCTNRKSELTDTTMNLYCAANPTAAICSCYAGVPEYIPQEIAGLAPCWSKSCATTGYIPQNMRGGCPSITVCKQDLNTLGDSNMLSNNIIVQDCGGKQNTKPLDNSSDVADNDAVKNAQSLSGDQSNIWTPRVILLIIIIGIVIVGICIYEVVKWIINKNKKSSDETLNE